MRFVRSAWPAMRYPGQQLAVPVFGAPWRCASTGHRARAESRLPVDILLINASVLSLPVSKRASVIVYDGPSDLRLWRPPGPDRALSDAYGDGLDGLLDKERERLEDGELPRDKVLRLHPGKLHCDYLLWVASRPPHGETEQAPAPDLAAIERAANAALMYASERDVVRLAFPAMGAGPDATEPGDRMAAVIKAAHAFKERCFQSGAAPRIEEVLVCHPGGAAVSKAKRLVARMARDGTPPAPKAKSESASTRRTTRAGGTARKSTRGPRLDPDALLAAKGRAEPYDRSRYYSAGDWFLHPKFGAGQVQAVREAQRMVEVLFEDGGRRTMVHAR